MKKKWMYYAACGLGLAACSSNESADGGSSDKGDGGSLVVYSPNSEGLIGATIPAFEEKYGIKVELIQAGTGELFKKLESEKEAPVADVIFGGSYTQYATHGELFENYTSKENDNVIKEYQNTTGYSTPYTLDGSVLIVNPDLTKGMNIEGYSDLLKPELKGKIATADPANSSSAFAQLTNMLQAQGGYKDDKAWSYVKDLFTLIDGKKKEPSSYLLVLPSLKKRKIWKMPRNLSILLSLKKYKIHLVQPLLTVLFVKMPKQAKI